MSELGVQSWSMLAADLGPQNPLSPLDNRQKPKFEFVSRTPDEILGSKSWGHVADILPCTLQDGYSRHLHPRGLPASIRPTGRIRLLWAQASLAEGDLVTVLNFHREMVIPVDLDEGEKSLSDLWFDYHTRRVNLDEPAPFTSDLGAHISQKYPIPAEIDFSMIMEDYPGE